MDTSFIQTKASARLKKVENNYVAAVYEDYKPKGKRTENDRKEEESENRSASKNIDAGPSINVKKVKTEIMQLSISGFESTQRKEAKIQQAIKLGARPPKNKYKNYKLIQKERRDEKLKKLKTDKLQQIGKNQVGKSIAKGKSFNKNRQKTGLLNIYGNVKAKDLKTVQKFKHKKKP